MLRRSSKGPVKGPEGPVKDEICVLTGQQIKFTRHILQLTVELSFQLSLQSGKFISYKMMMLIPMEWKAYKMPCQP